MPAPTIVLFDIDGTLISTGGASRAAIVAAFARRFAREDLFDDFAFGGRTDRGIVRHGLTRAGLDPRDEDIDGLIEEYLPVLEATLATAPEHRLQPGVIAVLDALVGRCALGLGTGNVERGARIKIERFGLNPRFEFGGFGCDAEERGALIATGIRRGAARLRVAVAACRAVVVGDTPLDVAAARANGARCVAVATGGATRAALLASAPDALFDDLTAEDVIEAILA